MAAAESTRPMRMACHRIREELRNPVAFSRAISYFSLMIKLFTINTVTSRLMHSTMARISVLMLSISSAELPIS